MRYLTYIIRNARRNPVRSFLTIASTSTCLFLMMMLLSFFAIKDDTSSSWKIRERIVTLNANGLGAMVPISYVDQISELSGVVAATPFFWYGGKYQEEVRPFAQFGVDPDRVFTVRDEFTIAPDQLKAFQAHRDGCVIGRKLAHERRLSIGDALPLKGDVYPVDLNLTIRGIYDGPNDRNLRMCLFRWDYFDEAMKRVAVAASSESSRNGLNSRISGNAGMIFVKCRSGDAMAQVSKEIDERYKNSDYPTRSETEEVFGKLFFEMLGDLKGMVRSVSLAMLFSVLCVTGNTMAMSIRERTPEVAVLKAIGFGRWTVLYLVMSEAVLLGTVGGILGAVGCKGLCEFVDVSQYSAGFLPYFYVPWHIVFQGLTVSMLIGVVSGIYPAIVAANLNVIDGLRRVI